MPELYELSDPKISTVVERLAEAHRPERIHLSGSQARGDAGPNSDYDLMVVVADSAPIERRRSRLAYQVLWGTEIATDVVVYTESGFSGRLRFRSSLSFTVHSEGILVYAA